MKLFQLVWFHAVDDNKNVFIRNRSEIMSEANADGLVAVEASVTSVFYTRPSPGDDPYVAVGDNVDEDTVVCLLEIMKCYRSVTAGLKGTVEKVLAENGAMVHKGDTLMLIRPDK
jgi:acetyl-CoA carboxylase biotin carboxyl carrier protein